ncbi:MAG: GHKL domain-containing protein [Lachnospiraceae bacterium]|nr:GHKL domain-containing protein [Lachnospiraceae bacterium]
MFLVIAGFCAWGIRFDFSSKGMPFFTALIWPVYCKVFFKVPFSPVFCWELFAQCMYLLFRTLILLLTAGTRYRSIKDTAYVCSDSGLIITIFLVFLWGTGIWLLQKHIKSVMRDMLLRRYNMFLFLAVIEWFLVCFVFRMGWFQVGIFEVIIGFLCITAMFVIIVVQILISQCYVLKIEKINIISRNNRKEQEFLALKESYENSRKLLHNKKYELQHVLFLIEQQKDDDAKRFIKDIFQQIGEQQKKYVWTGVSEIDILLSKLKQKSEEQQILLQVDCDIRKIAIETADFCVLLGNLLDNALEAAQQCPKGKRFISILIKNVNEMTVLKITNTYQQEPVLKIDGRFQSGKSGDGHGWGIESVKDIVKRYSGEIDIKFMDHRFYVSILI